MGDDQNGPPLARRVPGATRAAPGAPERPALPDALLQRMQAVVSAAHAQAAEEQRLADEEETRRKQAVRPDRPSSPPRRMRAEDNGRRPPLGAEPASSPAGWSDADDDTSPLPRLTASGVVASPAVNNRAEADRAPKPDTSPPPGRAAEQERQRAAGQERARPAQPERHRVAAAVRAPADLLEHPRPGAPEAAGRRFSPVIVIAAAVALVAAGSLAVVLSSRAKPAGGRAHAVTPATLAAAWVAHQVSRTATVGCDPAMCRALKARGLEHLLVLGSPGTDPLHGQVLVATLAVRQDLGARLGSVYAPGVIASFGSGQGRVDVRVVAPAGPAAYLAALSTDVQNRKREGGLLLSSSRVVASGLARRQMLAGQVDTQLLAAITGLAAYHPVDVLAFGDSAPGASAGIPLRSAELAETGGAAATRLWLGFLQVQKYPFLPALTETIRLHGKPVLLIEFAAPTPLGLLAS